MTEGQVLGVMAGIVGFSASVIGVGIWVGRVSSKAESASQRSHDLSNKLAAFQVEVARDYASKAMLSELKGDIMEAIKTLGDRLDRLLHSPRE